MLTTIINSLTSLREFFSRAFFVGAFIPTAYFIFTNAIILYLWSWPAHNWIKASLFENTSDYRFFLWGALLAIAWIYSYLVAALTPLMIRTLEGKNWKGLLRETGIRYHAAHFNELTDQMNMAVRIYTTINDKAAEWHMEVANANKRNQALLPNSSIETRALVEGLRVPQKTNQLIPLSTIENLVATYTQDIQNHGVTDELSRLADDVTQLIAFAKERAETEHSRLLNARNAEFGDQETIAPTLFGNVGLTAQAYAMRAYHCNLPLIWNALRRVIERNDAAAKSLESCKFQLDFLVSSFWLTLLLSGAWAVVFALYGEVFGAILSACAGPVLCSTLWYGASVEQYRVLQNEIITLLNAFRFEVLSDLHSRTPMNLAEERLLWRAIDFALGSGQATNLCYQPTKP